MRRRLRTLLLALALVAAAIWFYRSRTPPAPPSDPHVVLFAPPSTSASATAKPRQRPAPRLDLAAGTADKDASLAKGSFEGHVLSRATGLGVAGAEILVAHGAFVAAITCDASGAFRFVPKDEGPHAVRAITAKGYFAFTAPRDSDGLTFVARAGERVKDLVFYLQPSIEYVGLVRDKDKKPIEGAKVLLYDSDGEELEAAPRLVTDAAGEVHFSAPEESIVGAEHPEYGRGSARIDLRAHEARRVVITLGERRAGRAFGTIEGRVVDPTNQPIEGAIIRAWPERGGGDNDPTSIFAKSGANGAFRLDGLDAPGYELGATHEHFAGSPTVHEKTGATGVVLALTRGGSIRGKVRDKVGGAPVVAFTVVAWKKIGPLQRDEMARATRFDANGEFEVDMLEPGSYAVTVVAHGFAPAAEQSTEVSEREPDVLSFELGKGARVFGEVSERDDKKPIANAKVSVEGVIGPSSTMPLFDTATTDAKGKFEIAGLSPGTKSLYAEAAGHDGRIVSGVSVGNGDGGETGPIAIDLAKVAPGEEPKTELTGIGAVLSGKDDALVIGKVLDGGGAKDAGLVAGDAIVGIDGERVVVVGFGESIQRIRGPEGSTVRLSVRRAEGAAPVEIAVVRKRIRN